MSYGKVKETFWTDRKVQAWSDDAKMLALYLMTGPHRNVIGCMRVPDGYLLADLGWEQTRLSDAIAMLSGCHFICRDDDGWTIILNQLKHDPIKVPNHARSAIAVAATVPTDSVVYQELVPRLSAALEAIGMASLWHRDEIVIPEPSPEPSPEPEPSSSSMPMASPEPDDDRTASPGRSGRRTPVEESARLDQTAVVMADQFLHQHAIYWPDEGELRMARMPLLTLRAEAREWIEAGVDLELFIDVMDKRMAQMAATGKSPPRSIKAFHLSLHDAVAARMAG